MQNYHGIREEKKGKTENYITVTTISLFLEEERGDFSKMFAESGSKNLLLPVIKNHANINGFKAKLFFIKDFF